MMLKNITWTVSARYITQGMAVLSNVLLARYLGVDGFGEYALASSVLLIGNAFTSFGMDMVLIRSLASGNDPTLLADGLLLQLSLSVLWIVSVLVVGLFVFIPLSMKIYMVTLLPLSFYSIFSISIRARQQMQVFAVAQLLTAFLQLLAVFLLWLLNGEVTHLVVLLLVMQTIVAAWGFYSASSFITWQFSLQRALSLLKNCAQMAVIGTLRLVYEKIAIILMPALAGLSMTGLFSASSRVLEAGKLGHLSAFTAMYPEMARNEDFGKQSRGLQTLLWTAVLISAVLFLLAEPLVRLLFGDEFFPAVVPLRILVWSIVPYVIVTYVTLGLVALGVEKPVSVSLLVSLTALLTLLILLTPRFNLAGSAAAILAAELIHAALLWHQWRIHVLSKLS